MDIKKEWTKWSWGFSITKSDLKEGDFIHRCDPPGFTCIINPYADENINLFVNDILLYPNNFKYSQRSKQGEWMWRGKNFQGDETLYVVILDL